MFLSDTGTHVVLSMVLVVSPSLTAYKLHFGCFPMKGKPQPTLKEILPKKLTVLEWPIIENEHGLVGFFDVRTLGKGVKPMQWGQIPNLFRTNNS